jgi:phage tail-like protein
MRIGLTRLPTRHPIGEQLPGVYAEDEFVQGFTGALDDVLSPVFATLDSFSAYLDPRLAPADFLDWLARWVALDVDESWTPAQRRELITKAVELHRWRGTRRGLAEHVMLLTGGVVEVTDSGGSSWSPTPDTAPPGEASPWVRVRVSVEQASEQTLAAMRSAVEAAVAAAKPAHVAHSVEVVSR